jgi:hypothetical protein
MSSRQERVIKLGRGISRRGDASPAARLSSRRRLRVGVFFHALPRRSRRRSRRSARRLGADERPASRKQLAYIEKLTGQILDFNQQQLVTLCDQLVGKPPADLSCLGASTLIAVLQDLQAGRVDLDTALNRAA